MKYWLICALVFWGLSMSWSARLPTRLPSFTTALYKGDTLHTDSIKKTVVCVYFWASWSSNSRKHNRNLIKLYEKYRSKDLRKNMSVSFIGISLDENKQRYKTAMAQDDMHWPYNICDFKGWYSPFIGQFGVQSLPSIYVFNHQKQLVATQVWGNKLDSLLAQLSMKVSN